MTTKTSTNIETFPDTEDVTIPRIVKRRGQRDRIIANFKKRSTFRWVAFDSLHIDPRYQRRLRASRATTMAHNWNPEKMGVLVVSRRADGRYYIVDGQHRFAALQLIENHPPRVYCEVFEGLTQQEEARLFHDLDNERANLTAGASFKALSAADDEIAQGVMRAANRSGLTVDYEKGPVEGNVRAFKTLQEIYHRRGEDGLARILSVCSKAWPHSSHAASASLLLGMEIFFERHGNKVNDARLASVLSSHDPRQIINTARIINGTLSSIIYPSIATALRIIYNKGMRKQRLEEIL